MTPPICELCHERFGPDEGGLVTFAPAAAGEAWHERAAGEPGFVGHPSDRAWFCSAYVDVRERWPGARWSTRC